jgi:hypothetical protein
MHPSLAQRLRCWWIAAVLVCIVHLQPDAFSAELIAARYPEGSLHGFLVLRTMEGRTLAVGDLIQVVRGNRVVARLLFRFKDGSVDDETTVFTQRGSLRLLTNRHIQKGPSFPHPIDLSIDVPSGQITVRFRGDDGEEKVTRDHLDLPAALANGLILSVMKNIPSDSPEIKVPLLVATPKPRIVQLAISPQGDAPVSIAGFPRKATRYLVKIELGGMAGLIAPLIGKQPKDGSVWMLGGEAPVFLRADYPLYDGGPIWSMQLTGPSWPRTSAAGH